ncbi:MAG: transketolase [Alphaproteobacteria bacterium]
MTAAAEATHAEMANAIRALAMDAVEQANSGHPGMPMGMADIATVLFRDFLSFDPADPHWPDRDRFVLSNGHGSMLLYAVLHLTGYADMTIDELRRFRQLGSKTAGHPEYGHATGIETTTGPLGQGLANAVGMALAERRLNAEFGDDLVDHYTYVFAGDGCLMEGISHEAVSLAGHLKLGRLIVLFDDNGISIDGATDLSVSDDQLQRFSASGWHVQSCDGHDEAAIRKAIEAARKTDRPSLIACRTVIGFGAPEGIAGTADVHGKALGGKAIAAAREALGWSWPPFELPNHIVAAWRGTAARGAAARGDWTRRLQAADSRTRHEFERRFAGTLPEALGHAVQAAKQQLAADMPKLATRVASQQALEALAPVIPELLGGSADLTGSNNTRTKAFAMDPVKAGDYRGGYVYYGVREHGMAAAINGIALHGGLIPYGGTFLVFSDYMRPALRLAALMGIRVIQVLTHDSIGLGEDGPTHQPVEHLAALRAIPNMAVFRPADAMETLECWALALARQDGPSVLALTRQNLPALRDDGDSTNRCARGAYLLRDPGGARDVTLIATGSEVMLAVEAAEALAADGLRVAVVSAPCLELFARQDERYRAQVLGPDGGVRVAVEAALMQGWDRTVGVNGATVGMTGFGASGPIEDLFPHFGITAAAVAEAARERLAAIGKL